MKKYDVVIIGASAAGATAAITAKRFYADKKMLIIRSDKMVPIPCGIPYIFGTVGDAEKNLIPVDKIMAGKGIDVLVDTVSKIDKQAKKVVVSDEEIAYDKLVVATGSNPITPPIKGITLANVYPILKKVDYLKGLLQAVQEPKHIVIIGGGFIGVEMAEEFKKSNPKHHVSIVEMQSHCLNLVYDQDFSELAEAGLLEQGITLHTEEKVVELKGHQVVESVELESGKSVKADIVILGIGCRPNVSLAKEAGLELGNLGGIYVYPNMQTTDPDIFACGDCAEKISFFDKKPSGLKLASIATTEARIVGANLYKPLRANSGVVGCFSTSINKKAFAAAGLTTREAEAKGISYVVGNAESINRHPGLMPGAEKLKVRLLFDTEHQAIIGGQIYGAYSGGELINAVSAFISQRVKADDIALFQAGTHPALTASPIAYQLVNAAEDALQKLRA